MVQAHDWSRITVVGEYDRTCIVSQNEKRDKMFNWHRPTAELQGSDNIVIKCFPGLHYVYHYGLIIATYLAMEGRYKRHVYFVPPSLAACDAALTRIGTELRCDTIILGWGVDYLAGSSGWTYANTHAWKSVPVCGKQVLFLGFLPSMWGDVAGRIVTKLAAQGAKRILYIGKVGALNPIMLPNTCLATGTESLLDGQRVRWRGFFDMETRATPGVVSGLHVTSQSVLLETRRWLGEHSQYDFVDPEIGPMGAAASDADIAFGYLHVVSNNLASQYDQDLSNERMDKVRQQRMSLLDKAKLLIEQRLLRIEK